MFKFKKKLKLTILLLVTMAVVLIVFSASTPIKQSIKNILFSQDYLDEISILKNLVTLKLVHGREIVQYIS